MAITSSLAVLGAIVLYLCWRLLFWLRHDPLSTAPKAHWSVPYSGLWIWWQHFHDRSAEVVHQAHLHHGPVVRLAPAELSVCSVGGGLDVIYSFKEAMPKTDWYQAANAFGEEPMVAIIDEAPHKQRKKLLAQPYMKTSIRNNQTWLDAQPRLTKSLARALESMATPSSETDFYDLVFGWSVDSITEYLFGQSASMDLLADLAKARQTRQEYETQRANQFLPLPTMLLHRLGFRPELAWVEDMQAAGENESHTVYQHMRLAMTSANKKGSAPTPLSAKERAILLSEMQDHVVAAVDTTAILLTACAWQLSLPSNQTWQTRLRDEVRTAGSPTLGADLEPLPILDAITKEVLRLHTPLAGRQPRRTHRPVVLGPPGHQLTVPAGVTVHSQAQTLHRSPAFPDAETFDPARWLDTPPEALKEMERWYWPFGSGSRACTGTQLGIDNLKLAIATLYGRFATETVEGSIFATSRGILAMPIRKDGYYLRLRVQAVEG
ncbi:hypothetical protein LTR53_005434 [Teratosphaeriaceae sp. CCFEE 6253]|nr:hypothetical protein LTR53_005434 [Teratosphaeriaceae sp. CCFEE 6253]